MGGRYCFPSGGLRTGLLHPFCLTDRNDLLVSAANPHFFRANLQKFADKFGVKPYGSWTAMLETEKLDAVTVCTPNAMHVQPTVDAIKAGCHVMVEKPMGMNAGECRNMIAAAKAAGKHLVIGVHVLELADYVIGMPEPEAAVGNTWTYIGDKPSSIACA